jgi:septal ring factor EnvC (AmiA/AmiB activator)
MNNDRLEQLLQAADKSAGRPVYHTDNLADFVHRRARRRRIKMVVAPIAAAFLILAGFWILPKTVGQKPLTPEQIASLNTQIRDLNKRVDATLNLVREVLAQQKAQQRLDELNAQLAAIPDPLDELNKKVEKTAFILVYYADKRYEESGNPQDVIQTYNRVIELFPDTRSAKLAKQKLVEIQKNKTDNQISL